MHPDVVIVSIVPIARHRDGAVAAFRGDLRVEMDRIAQT
jgi:hypothetical protein